MARTSTYLNFMEQTEEAFNFYKAVFGTEFNGPIQYMKDAPPQEGYRNLSEKEQNLVMHVELPITGGHLLMGTDALESVEKKVTFGNNISINLEPDTVEETDRLFSALSEGAKIEMALKEMFWGGYFGALTDKFGVQWMFNCDKKNQD